jgi:hypothetical protein
MADTPTMYDLMKDEPIWKDGVENKHYSATGGYVPFISQATYSSLAEFDWQSSDQARDLKTHTDFLYCGNIMRGLAFDESNPDKKTWHIEEFVALPCFQNHTYQSADEVDILVTDGQPWINPITAIVEAIFNTKYTDYDITIDRVTLTRLIAINPTKVSFSLEESGEPVSISAALHISMTVSKPKILPETNPTIVVRNILVGQEVSYGWDGAGVENWLFRNVQITATWDTTGTGRWSSVEVDYDDSSPSFDEPMDLALPVPALMPACVYSTGWVQETVGTLSEFITQLNFIVPNEPDPDNPDSDKFNDQLSYLMANLTLHEEEK